MKQQVQRYATMVQMFGSQKWGFAFLNTYYVTHSLTTHYIWAQFHQRIYIQILRQ